MSNLPIQFIDKENSPALLAFMQQFGEKSYVDAELINKFRDALNELHARTADTRIVENTGLQIVGTDVVINELWKWLILSILYSNDSQITLPITLSSEGNQKLCYLCANQDNGFELVYGPESETNPVAPTIPDNLLYITFFLVTDGTVGTPAEPIVGDIFIEKTDFLVHNFVGSGSDVIIPLLANGASEIRMQSGLTPLISIDGFDLSLITGNPDAKVPYNGKIFLIRNTSTAPITLKNFGDADFKFYSLSGTDVVIPVNGTITVKYNFGDGEYSFTEYFRNWTEPIDLSQKADLVGGKVPASQLPSYVDDVIEGYFNGTNFYTDAGFTTLITPESGKIYVALDTNLQYRWSGSAYVQIGGVSESDTYSYWFSYTASHVTSAILYTQVANAILATSGTQSLITRVGTNLYNSYHFLNWVSATANGSKAGVKNNNNADVPYRAGVEAYIIFGNNSDNVNHVTAVGSYGLLSAVPNLDIANFTTDFVGVGNDPTDTNLSFYCKRQDAPSSYIKVPTNSNFPAHTLASDIFMLKFETNRVSVQADFQIKLTLTNLINGATISHTFTGLQCPDLNRAFINTVNRSNRNTGVATAIRWIKTHIKAKYIY